MLSETAAILVYLAKKSRLLIPDDVAGEAHVVRWCFAAMNTLEPPLLDLLLLGWTAEGGCNKHRDFLVSWANRMLKNLERWLTGRTYVATEAFTIADILIAHVLSGIKDESLLRPYIRTKTYRDRCLARPQWRHVLERYCARVEAG